MCCALRCFASWGGGGDIYLSGLHVPYVLNRADAASRFVLPIPGPSIEASGWFQALAAGDARAFDIVVAADRFVRPLRAWVRLLLLLGGDVERNPGPPRGRLAPLHFRPGSLVARAGFAANPLRRWALARRFLRDWLAQSTGLSIEVIVGAPLILGRVLRAFIDDISGRLSSLPRLGGVVSRGRRIRFRPPLFGSRVGRHPAVGPR